jgi:hypothetical protein
MSEETKQKISAALSGRKMLPEQVERMAATKRGKKQKPETVARRVEKLRGKTRSLEQRQRMSLSDKASWTAERRDHYSEMYAGKRFGGGEAAGEYLDQNGYRMITGQWGHPLATSNGSIGEHRMVLYEKIGPGAHHCYGCGKLIEWKSPERTTDLCADHLDNDTLNNDPDNLEPSCFKCNWDRGKCRT